MLDKQKQIALNIFNKYKTSVKIKNKAKLSEAAGDCWRYMKTEKWENYLPARNSTFCDLPDFTLPRRILRHTQQQLPSLEDRLTEIFENDPSKNNFRSAQLIRDYGEETGRTSLSQHESLCYYDTCLSAGRKRLDDQYNDFIADLQLYEQYGSLSDVMGEKSRIQRNITAWYHICARTGDYGFYTNILDAYKDMIAYNAEEHGKELRYQLQVLRDDSSYDFGVYSYDKILGYIEEQNFTVAENMLNCVRRHDVAEISDYAEEPFGYLSVFLSEVSSNHRAVADASVSLEHSVLKYTQKKDLERALRQISNSPMKDVRGGVNLISSWVNSSSNPEKITRLLNLLGICGCTAERDGFRVLCLYGSHDCGRLLDAFREVNSVARHTIVFLDYPLNIEERRKLARKLKETVSFARTFLVIDRVLLFYLARHYAANTVSRISTVSASCAMRGTISPTATRYPTRICAGWASAELKRKDHC